MEKILRTYQHVAQETHWCDRCCRHIQPGEIYEGSVYVSKLHGLYTLKIHVEPSCDYPWEDEDSDEYLEGLEHTVEEPTKKAATDTRKAA